MANEPKVDLRGDCPRETVDVLDAVSGSRRMTRTELVNEILGNWAAAQIHQATVIYRVLQINPSLPESAGTRGDSGGRKGRDSGFGELR